jgi:hypothetical protein
MAMTDKEAALRTIEHLPDDASWDEIVQALRKLSDSAGRNGVSATSAPSAAPGAEDEPEAPVTYHLERRGYVSVLVPDRPVPPITVEMVNDIIEEIRREREDRWLGLTDQDGQ